MRLEICASNYQSAINAQEAGADRIELCKDLSVGGLTPNLELFERLLKALSIPIYVLIRPRPGDFEYSREEFENMKQHIQSFKRLGCHGVVSGVLKNKLIDLPRTQELIEWSKPLPFTFHRAFDDITNPFKGVNDLVKIGASRILTSGQELTAKDGLELLKELLKAASNRIIILPGAGISPDNAYLFKENGFQEIHASATGKGSISDIETIKAILNTINE
ncbi:MAG: copper homeostasis protein CutC [Flavobacteriaceae bacterium]|nr:copper homeostasis protein CutC [Flavobacteriaceae bacterium]